MNTHVPHRRTTPVEIAPAGRSATVTLRGARGLLARGRAEQRYVVSVDQHGEVDSLAAEPVRW